MPPAMPARLRSLSVLLALLVFGAVPSLAQNAGEIEKDFREGDELPVKVLEVDRQGKIRLSLKEARRDLAEATT